MSDLPNVPTKYAKKTTLFAMKVASIWIAVFTIVRAGFCIFNMNFLPMNEIIYSGLMIGMIYAPVYISVILDKFKEIILAFKGKDA
jgi:hypothetical protein